MSPMLDGPRPSRAIDRASTRRVQAALDQSFALVRFERRQPRRARHRMAAVGEAGFEHVIFKVIGHFFVDDDATQRHKRRGQAFRQRHHVGRKFPSPVVLDGRGVGAGGRPATQTMSPSGQTRSSLRRR